MALQVSRLATLRVEDFLKTPADSKFSRARDFFRKDKHLAPITIEGKVQYIDLDSLSRSFNENLHDVSTKLQEHLEKWGLYSRIVGYVRIKNALKKTSTTLTNEEINGLVDFIERQKNIPGYYKSSENPICRTVEITQDGKIYIHLNRRSKGDNVETSDAYIRHSLSIDYTNGEIVKRSCWLTKQDIKREELRTDKDNILYSRDLVKEDPELFLKIEGYSRIKNALSGSDTKLTDQEIYDLVDFVEKNRGKPGYYRASENHICRSIEITPKGKIYIHLNRLSKGDTLIGFGAFKTVKFSIDYETGKKVVRTSELCCQELDNFWPDSDSHKTAAYKEIQKSQELAEKGVQNIVRILHSTDFVSKKAKKRICPEFPELKSLGLPIVETIQEYYVEGTLSGAIINRKFTPEQSAKIGLAIIRTINQMHKAKTLHLDLKPDNILLKKDENGEIIPVIIDLGRASQEDEVGRGLFGVGDHPCVASWYPRGFSEEDCRQSPGIRDALDRFAGKELDIYALAVILVGENTPKGKIPGLIDSKYLDIGKDYDDKFTSMILRMKAKPGISGINLDEVEDILVDFINRHFSEK